MPLLLSKEPNEETVITYQETFPLSLPLECQRAKEERKKEEEKEKEKEKGERFSEHLFQRGCQIDYFRNINQKLT